MLPLLPLLLLLAGATAHPHFPGHPTTGTGPGHPVTTGGSHPSGTPHHPSGAINPAIPASDAGPNLPSPRTTVVTITYNVPASTGTAVASGTGMSARVKEVTITLGGVGEGMPMQLPEPTGTKGWPYFPKHGPAGLGEEDEEEGGCSGIGCWPRAVRGFVRQWV